MFSRQHVDLQNHSLRFRSSGPGTDPCLRPFFLKISQPKYQLRNPMVPGQSTFPRSFYENEKPRVAHLHRSTASPWEATIGFPLLSRASEGLIYSCTSRRTRKSAALGRPTLVTAGSQCTPSFGPLNWMTWCVFTPYLIFVCVLIQNQKKIGSFGFTKNLSSFAIAFSSQSFMMPASESSRSVARLLDNSFKHLCHMTYW